MRDSLNLYHYFCNYIRSNADYSIKMSGKISRMSYEIALKAYDRWNKYYNLYTRKRSEDKISLLVKEKDSYFYRFIHYDRINRVLLDDKIINPFSSLAKSMVNNINQYRPGYIDKINQYKRQMRRKFEIKNELETYFLEKNEKQYWKNQFLNPLDELKVFWIDNKNYLESMA